MRQGNIFYCSSINVCIIHICIYILYKQPVSGFMFGWLAELGWAGRRWAGLGWAGLGWAGLGWIRTLLVRASVDAAMGHSERERGCEWSMVLLRLVSF